MKLFKLIYISALLLVAISGTTGAYAKDTAKGAHKHMALRGQMYAFRDS